VVISRAPDAPNGCPSAIAPPFTLSCLASAPVSASQASGTEANASLTSKMSMSARPRPARASTLAVAGIGAVSMITGSSPTTTVVCTLASGRRPSRAAVSDVVSSTAAAPSEICDDEAAVIRPPSTSGFNDRIFSQLGSRGPSSRVASPNVGPDDNGLNDAVAIASDDVWTVGYSLQPTGYQPLALHWIGGFGDIQWIPAEAYRPPSSDLAKSEADIIAHMNADHAAAMRDYCRFVHQREVLDVELAGVDCDGFDVRADGALLRFDFEAPALSPAGVRTALVDLARRARA